MTPMWALCNNHSSHLDTILQCYMQRLLVKDRHQHDTCYNEIGLSTQKMLTILGSEVSIIRRVYVITFNFQEPENLHLEHVCSSIFNLNRLQFTLLTRDTVSTIIPPLAFLPTNTKQSLRNSYTPG